MTNLPKIGLIADDFTGAMDSGAQFAYARLGVHFRFAGVPSGEVEIINTASREIPTGEAVRQVQKASRALAGRSLFKKIDSTLRGHAGAEIEAVLAASPYRKAVICPAVPKQGRSVRGGRLYVNGLPLEQSAFKDDPVYPAKTSRLDELLRRPAAHLPLDLVRGPQERLTAAITGADWPVITADAETDEDLAALARAIITAEALPCGAFGLARAWLQALNLPPADLAPFRPEGRALVIVGSANRVSREQVERLARLPGAQVIKLEADHSAALPKPSEEIRILALCASQGETIRTLEWLRFGQTVSDTALRLLESYRPQTIFAAGGETVTYFCRKAGAASIQILGEAAPGIPYGRVRGGRLDGLQLVTKAGGFGGPDELVNILDPLKEA